MSSAAVAAPAAVAMPAVAAPALPPSEFLSIGAGIKEKLAAMKAQKLAAKQAAQQQRAATANSDAEAALAMVDRMQQEFLSIDDPAADEYAHTVHEHALAGISSPAAAAASSSSTAVAAAAGSPIAAARPFASGDDFISLASFDTPAASPTPRQGQKRKAGAAALDDSDAGSDAAAAGATPAAPVQVEGAFKAPWATGPYTHRNFTVRLHEELLDFCAYVSPKPAEQTMRAELIDRLNALVREAFPSSPRVHLKPFGSYATKLYLPISDIDLVLFEADEGGRFVSGDKGKQSPLGVLERHMRAKQCATYLEHISGARIPILKLTDKLTGVKVDICYDVAGGLRAAEFIIGMQRQLPALRPLTLFLKYFLHCRVLNDTYKGGIGSFMLQLMLISHLQSLQLSGKLGLPTTNLGMLLMSFLESYGVTLNYRVVGLNMNAAQQVAIAAAAAAVTSDEAERLAVSKTLQASSSLARVAFYNKSSRGWANAGRPYLLSIENPLDPSHDVGANSYLIMRVRKALQFAYQHVSAHVFHENARLDKGEPLITRTVKQAVSRAADPHHPFASASSTPLTLLSLIVSVNDELRDDQVEVDFVFVSCMDFVS
jgi:non-canonical poly(A) RNA polymerase PAPD5/7